MNEYIIRSLQHDDLPALIELCRDHAIYEKASYEPANQAQNLAAHIFSDTPRLFCQVAVDKNGRLAGYCTWSLEYSTWKAASFIHMDCLYLQPYARNKKLGVLLMQKMVQHARELHIDEIQWQTPESNEHAIRFYNRIGASSKIKARFFLNPACFQAEK